MKVANMTGTKPPKEMAPTVSAAEAIGGTQKHHQSSANSKTAEILSNHQKQVANLRAQFAILGHALEVVVRAEDGRETYRVSRWAESRMFTHLNSVQAFLNQIGGAHV